MTPPALPPRSGKIPKRARDVPGTWIEVDAAALRHNIAALRDLVAPAELCMVVKGNAYGHGYDPIVPLAEAAGVRRFAVFSGREAANFLRASTGKSRLMVMGHSDARNIPWLVDEGVEIWINDVSDWPDVRQHLDDKGGEAFLHVELETGMNRTGLPIELGMQVAKEIHDHPQAHLQGVCTHLAGAEDHRNHERIAMQKQRFAAALDELAQQGIKPHLRHIASSASALRDTECRLDLVRVGIACYGLWPSPEVQLEVQGQPDLRRVLTWRSRILAVKDVPDGEFIGYGATYQAEGDTRVAIVPVGYGDGFARSLSNRGFVLVGGKRASIIGNVNMNMVQVNITHLSDAHAGDPVVLIGSQGDEVVTVASFSDFNNVVNYELMSRLSWEIPRIVVDSEAAR